MRWPSWLTWQDSRCAGSKVLAARQGIEDFPIRKAGGSSTEARPSFRAPFDLQLPWPSPWGFGGLMADTRSEPVSEALR